MTTSSANPKTPEWTIAVGVANGVVEVGVLVVKVVDVGSAEEDKDNDDKELLDWVLVEIGVEVLVVEGGGDEEEVEDGV